MWCSFAYESSGAAFMLVSVPDSLPKGGGRIWYSCIQKATMNYSLC